MTDDRKALRVLFVCHHILGGIRGRAIATALAGCGHHVTCVHTAPKAKLRIRVTESEGVRWVSVPDLLWGRARTGWDPWSTLRRIGYLRSDDGPYDLIHCFETRPATIHAAKYYSRKHQIPIFTDWNDWWGRGGIIDHFRPRWYRFLFGRMETYYEEAFRCEAVGTTVIARALGERAEKLGVPADSIHHLQGGTYPDYFLDRDRVVCRERVGLAATEPVLAFSSWQTHWDLEIVMKTLKIVAERYPNVKLMLTGKTNPQVVELARECGVEGRLLVTGFLSDEDLPWYLGCADVFLLPFPNTTYNVGRWPNKFGDYMALGRPTVSNPVGDLLPFFEKHEVGLLADCNEHDFAEKVVSLLDNPALAKQLGANARHTALEYDYPKLVKGLEGFYFRTLDDLEKSKTRGT